MAKHTLGMTFDAIGAEHGISRQRVSQIVRAATPRAPGAAERAQIALELRRKYDQLERIAANPPLKVSAMARPTTDPRTGGYVVDDSVAIRAIEAQNKIADRYRAMFGVDIHQPPATVLDARMQITLNQVNMGRAAAGFAPLPFPERVPPEFALPEDQARAACQASLAALSAALPPRAIPGKVIE
jgi:hypothetical protein